MLGGRLLGAAEAGVHGGTHPWVLSSGVRWGEGLGRDSTRGGMG